MAIHIDFTPNQSAPKTQELVERLKSMNSQVDQGQITHRDVQDAAISGLLSVIARIEADVEKLKRDDDQARMSMRF